MSDSVSNSNIVHKGYSTCVNKVSEIGMETERQLFESINNAYIIDALNEAEKYEKKWEIWNE